MKKILVIIIVAVVAANLTPAMAQGKMISFGVKAGLNYSNASEFISHAKADKMNSKPQFTGGLFMEVRPIRSLGISADVLYSGQGFKSKGVLDNGDGYSVDVKLGYLNIPVLVNYYVIGGLAVKAGVQFGYSLNYNVKTLSGEDLNLKDAFRKSELSIPVGLSYSFPFGLIVDARYTFGVTDVTVGSIGDIVLGKTKSQVFSITLGYRF